MWKALRWLLGLLAVDDRPRPGVCGCCRKVRVIQGNICGRCVAGPRAPGNRAA